jgi:hypothetical protein
LIQIFTALGFLLGPADVVQGMIQAVMCAQISHGLFRSLTTSLLRLSQSVLPVLTGAGLVSPNLVIVSFIFHRVRDLLAVQRSSGLLLIA